MTTTEPMARPRLSLWPLHAILLAFPIALFTIGVLTDIAYLNTAELQWTNFSAWLNAGGMVFGGLVGLWALIDVIRHKASARGEVIYLAVIAVMLIVGLINAFKHSQDGWSSVGAMGLILSILSALLALVAGWLLYSRPLTRDVVVREEVS